MKNLNSIWATVIVFFSISIADVVNAEHNEFSRKDIGLEESSHVLEWSGYYAKKSDLCTSPDNGENCSEQFHDCLKVEAVGTGYIVELYSVQANHNVCAFKFLMSEDSGLLVYKTELGNITLQMNSKSLDLSSKGIDPTALGLGVCGAHAEINGLRFPLVSKASAISQCPSGN